MTARRATTILFFLTGATFASFAARIPALQDRLDLSPGQLSLAFLALNGGAVAGLPGGSLLARRVSGRASLRLGFAIYPPGLIAVALAPGLGWMCLVLAVMAAANSVIDVAMNVQGVALERRARRPLLSGLHAAHSFGVLGGGLAGMGAAAAGLQPLAHFGAVAAIAAPVALAATRALIEDRVARPTKRRARPDRRLALLGLLAFCAFLCEGGANDWSAVHLRSDRQAGEAVAAAAFVAFSLALATPAAAPTLAGWAVFGAGLSLIAPALLGAAPALGGTDAPAAIGAVTAIGYLGAFSGPPLIGALAAPAGLSAALCVLVAAAAAIAVLAPRVLAPRAEFAR
jgi:MFS family permease